ncbi:MFS transporter [Paracraurococcus ruber]|uniref:MFS transporter n=1 Tax=Paracraurococcus ruber TaxID=77675 RepID=A0ABS1CWC4_9PROT|nr:MFS transporter [Paracraurococcus ruber]MBK1658606.1 MFS transporter [Paracraurococcus ruber]TDG30821.1 MFS transporter [Paracraurococcus ruber]
MGAGVAAGMADHGAAAPPVPIRVVAATVAGNALEFYDFVTYAFFAVYIGETFFPASTPFLSLLLSVAVFGVGFIFRPLGGLVIGAYADRAGRRPAMLLTIALITVGTLGLAVTPSYASIGIAAPLIVVACRLVQGLALGGEVGPATAFLLEVAPPGRRAFYSSWQLASQGIAALTAGAIGTGLSLVLSREDLASWGWRVPFILCLALIPVAVILRRAMPETLEHGAAAGPRPRLREHGRLVALGVLLILGGTVATYVGNYMTTFAISTLHFPPSIALAATVVAGLGTLSGALAGGWLADRYGRRPVMLAPRLLLALAVWPMFLWLSAAPSPMTLFAATAVVTVLTSMSSTAALVVVPELLPRAVRATGLAIAYAVGVSLFGGTTQFVITWLIGATGDPTSPAWYVTLTSLVTTAAMWTLPESRDRALPG